MKKIIKVLIVALLFISFKSKVNAIDTFYLGDHVPDIYIYMNRINKKVYRQFRMIYKSDTNELVYCIEPGQTLSSGTYESNLDFDEKYNLTKEKWNKIKLIAQYGYLYENHQDIKWYAITQYMIWHEVMPDNWELYFVDINHNRLENAYIDEIDEINRLVRNHKNKPNLEENYIFNLNDNIEIFDSNKLINNYISSKGYIFENKIYLKDNLNIGNNKINLKIKEKKPIIFYYNSNGQNILTRGLDIFDNFSFNVYITSGKVKINECDEETFKDEFIGGSYEILDQDDTVIEKITCSLENECITNNLPAGNFVIRVDKLNDNYETNKYIYDVEIKDNNISQINICSKLKHAEEKEEKINEDIIIDIKEDKKEENKIDILSEEDNNKKSESKNLSENNLILSDNTNVIEKENGNNETTEVDIPYTFKDKNYTCIFLFILTFGLCLLKYVKAYK